MIAGTFANTWRAFTSLGHSDTRANIAKRNLTPKPNWTTMWWECVARIPWLLFQCESVQITVAGGDKLLYQYIVANPEMGSNMHSCSICGKVGTSRSNLRMHIENIHFAGSFSHQCKFCEMTFPTRNLLYKHIKCHKYISRVFFCSGHYAWNSRWRSSHEYLSAQSYAAKILRFLCALPDLLWGSCSLGACRRTGGQATVRVHWPSPDWGWSQTPQMHTVWQNWKS